MKSSLIGREVDGEVYKKMSLAKMLSFEKNCKINDKVEKKSE